MEIFLVPSRTGKSLSAENTVILLSSSVASVLGYLISSEFLISAVKVSMLIAFNFQYMIVYGTV